MQIFRLSFLLLMTFSYVYQIYGFAPNNVANIILKISNINFNTGSLTHRDITEKALLQVTKDLLKDNPNSNPDINSATRIDMISSLTVENLIEAYFGDSSDDLADSYEMAIYEINEANEKVDTDEYQGETASSHFDSEQFQLGQNLLVKRKQSLITAIQDGSYVFARVQAGRMLHTLQDFYSHSNWVEMGNDMPYTVLGDPSRNPDNIAPSTRETCTDCVQGDKINIFGLFGGAEYEYECDNNIRNDINAAKILTSGYYTGQRDYLRNKIIKPNGKCSHGGFRDSSSDMPAVGGINKDSKTLTWSPHANLHDEAASIAIMASSMLLADVRGKVGNDTKFAAFLNVNFVIQTIISIAYVIDTTGSMGQELPEIQNTLPQIRIFLEKQIAKHSQVKLILVPFNDPDPGTTITTSSIDVFLNGIAALTANGGGDCPEPSIGAIIRAIKESEKGSPIYLFTDAGASDFERTTELLALVRETGVHITPILTGSCGSRKKRSISSQGEIRQHLRKRRQLAPQDLYEYIATYSGGQVLNVATADISELSSVITLSSERSFTLILHKTGTSSFSGSLDFAVDKTISLIVITLNGISISETIKTPGGAVLTTLDSSLYSVDLDSSSSYITTINVTNNTALYGVWQLTFNSASKYSIQISALSSLKFSYQLYLLDPNSHFGFSSLEGNPIQGQTLILLVTTSGKSQGVRFTKGNLLDSNGAAIQNFNLTETSAKSFASVLMPLLSTFQLEITGIDADGNSVQRISGSGVQISDVDLRLDQNSSRYNSLYPGNTSNVTLLLSNFGVSSTFIISITHDNINDTFSYNISANSLTLGQNETNELILTVTAVQNATDGDMIQFTITSTIPATTVERSNFVSVLFFVSTLPPPDITENMFAPDGATVDGMSLLLLLFTLLMNTLLQVYLI